MIFEIIVIEMNKKFVGIKMTSFAQTANILWIEYCLSRGLRDRQLKILQITVAYLEYRNWDNQDMNVDKTLDKT